MLPPSCLFQPEGLGAMAGEVFKMLMMICRNQDKGSEFPLICILYNSCSQQLYRGF